MKSFKEKLVSDRKAFLERMRKFAAAQAFEVAESLVKTQPGLKIEAYDFKTKSVIYSQTTRNDDEPIDGQMKKAISNGVDNYKSMASKENIDNIVSATGLFNPVSTGSESIQEEQKDPSSMVFDAAITKISDPSSELHLAGPVVQDLVTNSYTPSLVSPGMEGYVAETAWSYDHIAQKPQICMTVNWDTTQARGTEIGHITIPGDLDTLNNLHTSVFRQHYLVRWDSIEYTAVYSANPFVSGLACMSAIMGGHYTTKDSNYIRAITSNRVDFNACAMTQGCLVVPWNYSMPWMCTTKLWVLRPKEQHTLAFFVISPLKGTEGAEPSIPIRVTMKFNGLKLASPIPPHATIFEGYNKSTNVVGQMNSSQDTASVVYYPKSNIFANYQPGTDILQNRETAVEPAFLDPDTESQMSVDVFTKTEGIRAYFNWSVTDQPGTVLHTVPVTPVLAQDLGTTTVPLAYISRFAQRWRGDISFRNVVVKSAFHTGKLFIAHVPLGETINSINYMSFVNYIVDLKEDNIFEFSIPFLSDHQTLRVNRGDGIAPDLEKYFDYGSNLVIGVHTQLQANVSMQNTVECVLWTKAGDNFELYGIVHPTTFTPNRYCPPDPLMLPINNWARLYAEPFLHFTAPSNSFRPPLTTGTYVTSGCTFDIGGTNIYVTNLYCGGSYVSNYASFVPSAPNLPLSHWHGACFDKVSAEIEKIEGQMDIASAKHPQTVNEVPNLGRKPAAGRFPVSYERFTNLHQVLERLQIGDEINGFGWSGLTPTGPVYADPDNFTYLGKCFSFASGDFQIIVDGAERVVPDVHMRQQILPEAEAEELTMGAVKFPLEEGAYLAIDVPMMTDAGLCPVVRYGGGDMSPNYQTAFYIKGDKPVYWYRAAPNFKYRYWSGIPSILEQRSYNAKKRDEIPELPPVVSSGQVLKSQIDTLRRKMQTTRLGIIEGQMAVSRKNTEKMSHKEKMSRVDRMVHKFQKMKAGHKSPIEEPKTESQVQAQKTPSNPFEDSDEDEEVDHVSDCEEDLRPGSSTSSNSSERRRKPLFVPKIVHDMVYDVSDTVRDIRTTYVPLAHDLAETNKQVSNSFKKIEESTVKFNRAADSVKTFSERGNQVLDEIRSTVTDSASNISNKITKDGLVSTLFGDLSSSTSKLVQVLLVDAMECVVIRDVKKWIGMIVKLGIAMGVTNKIVDKIVSIFQKHTSWSDPKQSHQGDVSGQIGEEMKLPLIVSLISVIVMFASFMYTGGSHVDEKTCPTMFDWIAKRCAQTSAIDRGFGSLMKVYDKIHKLIAKVIVKYFPVNPDVFNKLNESTFLKKAKLFLENAKPLLKVRVLVKIFSDVKLRNNVIECDRLYNDLYPYYHDPEVHRNHGVLINKLAQVHKELANRIISIVDSSTVRIDPFHISFVGGSGVGKSYLASAVAYVLGRSQNIPVDDLYYARTPTSEFWDNYKCQEFVGIDDVDQQDTEEQAADMITIKSNCPKVLQMAHLETKGCLFTSRGIISTTNVPYPEPTTIKCKEAYKRRRNVLIDCIMVKPNREKDMSHLKFQFINPVKMSDEKLSDQMNFPQMMFRLACEYSQYLSDQEDLVRAAAPDTIFKKLYMYRDTDECKLKVFEICQEFFVNGMSNKPGERYADISEINVHHLDYEYPEVPDGDPTDYSKICQKVKKKKFPVTTSDSESDEEDQYEWDDHGSNEEITGQMSDLVGDSSQDCNGLDAEVIINNNEETSPVVEPIQDEFADAEEIPDVDPSFWEKVKEKFRNLHPDLMDLLYYVSNEALGISKQSRELPPDLNTVLTDAAQRFIELKKDYCKFSNFMERFRGRFQSRTNLRNVHEFTICVVMIYYYYKVMNGEFKPKEVMFMAWLFGRAISYGDSIIGNEIKKGLFSTNIRAINNKISPDSIGHGAALETMRTAQEICLLPWCVMSRVCNEAMRLACGGLASVARSIYDYITEGKTPEAMDLVKIGIGLVGAVILYKYFFPKKPVKDDLLGEMDDDGNRTLKIMSRAHAGLPNDGISYPHYHMCEKCKQVYKHSHKRTPQTHTYKLICHGCSKRLNNAEEGKEDKTVVEGVDDEDDLVAEAKPSSGEQLKEKFTKSSKARKIVAEAKPSSGEQLKDKFVKTKKLVHLAGEMSPMMARFRAAFGLGEMAAEALTGQSSDDLQMQAIMPSIKSNCVTIKIGGRSVNALMLHNKWMVTVYHLFMGLESDTFAYSIEFKGKQFPGILSLSRDIVQPSKISVKGKNRPEDVAFVNLSENRELPFFRDIRKHLARSDEFELVEDSKGLLLVKTHGEDSFTCHVIPRIGVSVDRSITSKLPELEKTVETVVAAAWNYEAHTESGACGSPLLVRNANMPHKLVGFHFGAASHRGVGFSYPLFYESVMRITEEPVEGQLNTEAIKPYCEELYDCFPSDLPMTHTLSVFPEGRCLILGKLKKEWVTPLPRTTDIRESPFYDEIYEHVTEPACLSDRDPRSNGDIIQRGLNKFGKDGANPKDPEVMKYIMRHRLKLFAKLRGEYNGPMRTLTEFEAINGIEGFEYIPPIKMDTSPGFPYVRLRPAGEKGKLFLFKVIGKNRLGNPLYEPGALLRRHLDEIWEGLKVGEIRHNYYMDSLKDERRKRTKLFKTRFFNVCNVAWLITYNRLFKAFDSFQLTMKFKMSSGLGMDMHGTDPTTFINWLFEVGTKFRESDAADWDGNLPGDLMFFSRYVKALFIYGYENDMEMLTIRKNACHACVHRIHIHQDVVYLTFKGMPSGDGGTASCNTESNRMQADYDWITLWMERDDLKMADLNMKELHVREAFVGDDAGGTTSDAAAEVYNDINIARVRTYYGINTTPPGKEKGMEQPFVSVEEFNFLKCNFVEDENFSNMWRMKMQPYVIQELTNWVTKFGDPMELFYSNMDDALRFSFAHGKEFYEKFRTDVNRVLDMYGQPRLIETYGSHAVEFYRKFDKVYGGEAITGLEKEAARFLL
jgi:hypothetical protein